MKKRKENSAKGGKGKGPGGGAKCYSPHTRTCCFPSTSESGLANPKSEGGILVLDRNCIARGRRERPLDRVRTSLKEREKEEEGNCASGKAIIAATCARGQESNSSYVVACTHREKKTGYHILHLSLFLVRRISSCKRGPPIYLASSSASPQTTSESRHQNGSPSRSRSRSRSCAHT